MEIVVTLCIQCKSELGRFRNSWNGIGNSYHSPVYPPVSATGLEATGDIYNGAKNSYIEHSLLQDIACISCQAVVGLRCEKAPQGPLLKENQLILRLTDMSVVTEDDGQKAKISILKSYPLSIASGKKPSGSRRAATVQSSPCNPQSALGSPAPYNKAAISRTSGSDDRLSIPPPNVTVSEVTRIKSWAEDAIITQQKDIDRISGTVDRIERDMSLFKDFMVEIRSELTLSRQLSIGEKEFSALRGDVDDLRQQLEENGQAISRASEELHKRSLEVIAQNFEHVSQNANEVDGLKSELKGMRARVKCLEDLRGADVSGVASSSPQLRFNSGQHKLKQSQIDDLRSPSKDPLTGPSQKKRRLSDSDHKAITPDRRNSQDRGIIEIISSEHEPSSPTRDPDDEQDSPDALNSTEKDMSVIQNPTSSALVLGESSGSSQVPVLTQTPRANDSSSSTPRQASSRIEVRIPYSTALAKNSLQQQVIQLQNSDGVLLPPNGNVNKLSSRPKRRKTGEENPGPEDEGDNQEAGALEPDREWPPPKRSTGRVRGRKITSSPASASTSARQKFISPDEVGEAKKIFKCGGCGKEYRNIKGLDYHHSHSEGACSKGDDDTVPRIFQCGKCKKVYSVHRDLDYHLKYSDCNPSPKPHASSMNPTTCNTCNREFKSRIAFYAHKCVRAGKQNQLVTARESHKN